MPETPTQTHEDAPGTTQSVAEGKNALLLSLGLAAPPNTPDLAKEPDDHDAPNEQGEKNA